MFLLAALLWPAVRSRAAELEQEDLSRTQALFVACDEVLEAQRAFVTIPRRIQYPIRDMMVMQERFTQRRGKRPARLVQHQRFRAAYDLLLLRAEVGEVDAELAEWWTRFQDDPQTPREGEQRPRKRRRRPRRRRSNRPAGNA